MSNSRSNSRSTKSASSSASLTAPVRSRLSRMGLRNITSNVQRNNGTVAFWDTKASSSNNNVVYTLNMSTGTMRREVYRNIDENGVSEVIRAYGINPRTTVDRKYKRVKSESNAVNRIVSLVKSYRSR